METISENILDLAAYGLATDLIDGSDIVYIVNSLLDVMQEDGLAFEGDISGEVVKRSEAITASEIKDGSFVYRVLENLLDEAEAKELIPAGSIVYRDLFDTRLMGVLTPRPYDVIWEFNRRYKEDPVKATDWYYEFSGNTNYIRKTRVAKDLKWVTATQYGGLDITINLSKPEKDPVAIAKAGKSKQTGYPKCQLCRENEGYSGRTDHPARQNHRIIPITINDSPWFLQYSPYVYYNEHCIVFNKSHVPMKIDHAAFCKLFDFVKLFPHYFVGSNADLPIVGGSILSHDHFQGGHYEFPMARAGVGRTFTVSGFEDVSAGIVDWPMSVIRLSSADSDRVIALADKILSAWRSYTDEDAFIYAYTDDTPHNTITPIARKRGNNYELDLVLRNNITTDEHPMGVFHPHAQLHHIKKENIGLIEVMGLAVLPSRLRTEMTAVKEAILAGRDLRGDELTASHADWVDAFRTSYDRLDEGNIDKVLEDEIGKVFLRVLTDAGVYKRDEKGMAAFDRFIASLG